MTALVSEAGAFESGIRPGDKPIASGEVLISVCGMGLERAHQAATSMAQSGARALVSWGSCAGLDAALKPGQILLATTVVGADAVLPCDETWRTRLLQQLRRAGMDPASASLAHTDDLLCRAEDKQALRRSTGAVAADMESYAVAQVAASHALPFVVVRAILDPAGASLPPWLAQATDRFGRPRFAAVVTKAMAHPRDLAALTRLAVGSRAAHRALRRVRDGAGASLCWY